MTEEITNNQPLQVNTPKGKTRICDYCKSEVPMETGLKNWRNLFRKPSFNDWLILVMLIGLLFMGYLYSVETKQARDTLNHIPEICAAYNSQFTKNATNYNPYETFNATSFFSNLNIGQVNKSA